MADGAPLKYTDILNMIESAKNQSLAMTVLPGQGQIPAPSAEFMASNRNPFPDALGMPRQAMTMDSLAGTLGQMGQGIVVQPGHKAVSDRQDSGFFAKTLKERLGNQQ